MSLLRILASLSGSPTFCRWVLIEKNKAPVSGEGPLSELPRHTERVQLIFPAAQVMFTRVALPPGTKNPQGSALAYAIEDEMMGEPDAHQVSWLGLAIPLPSHEKTPTEDHQVAVIDKAGLMRWQEALRATDIDHYEIHCETLFLPFTHGEWSVAWSGSDGFVRNGEWEGTAIVNYQENDTASAPLSLVMMIEEARANQTLPTSIALYTLHHQVPDTRTWSQELGVPFHLAGSWDWRTAPLDAGVNLAPKQKHWRVFTGFLTALRPATAILCAAVVIHLAALLAERAVWMQEQRNLHQKMEAQFRLTFPEAVAVSDPALQMRRKLSEAYGASGQSDNSDFLPMIEQVATAITELPAGSVRTLLYDSGSISIELATLDEADQQKLVTQLLAAGLETTITRTGTSVLLSIWVS